MEILQIREAKARFSALVAAAEKGRPTLVMVDDNYLGRLTTTMLAG